MRRLVVGAEITLTVALGVLVALVFYALFAPLPAPEGLPLAGAPRSAAVTAAVRSNANPFRPAIITSPTASLGVDDDEPIEETDLNLILHGVRVDQTNRTAIIRLPSGEQKIFMVGDEILSGVVLNDAYRDQVTIARNGVQETLTLVNRDPKVARANARAERDASRATAVSPASASPTLRNDGLGAIANYIRAMPAAGDEGLRIVLNPGPDASLFRASGLMPGDALVEIDGQDVTRDVSSTLSAIQGLSPGSMISLTIERDGTLIPLDIEIPQFEPATN